MATLTDAQRAKMPKSAFAYIDSRGQRRLPIFDEAHVRSALSRFNQVQFESEAARDEARTRLLKAARKYGVVPVGFIQSQLRKERTRGRNEAQARRNAHLPRGTVTFLMTDVEGSTALLAELGDAYGPMLSDVRRLIREKVRRAGGHEVETHADEFLGVFASAAAACGAAVMIQGRMAEKDWPSKRPVKVRIGIHRGHPTLADGHYIGLSVHAVARLCQAGHGGQIVLSRAAREAMVDGLPEGVGYRALGRHRLRGFPRPDLLYQVTAPGLRASFPRLRTR
ncbi:MAG TPA: adenylate/guanylate cyclase domain-containing protein [Candidatus Limnocylindria bacterium]|nr:adenylate/guanylate cyclase domain-containing protein [Candidatus Limnocylindria bacterium]